MPKGLCRFPIVSITQLLFMEARSFHNSQSSRMLAQTITLAEINNAVQAVKNDKSTGSDRITGNLIK